ncbi:hypothetical protein [Christiangramia sediminis]|uniref:Uncharacterized protein n=1 Tax=Christiangramia sediminis TaxID=2881336 RepID=A0A9X1LJP4_9FLAO|nr:hypothetical protein [Christiangramia sediminis]MCB7481628.1 hypothetical protein [Christiangramia sediminis]
MKQFFAAIFLCAFLSTLSSCEGGRGGGNKTPQTPPTNVTPAVTSDTPVDATVKIYFENTLSMDGYINGNTGFKNVFRDLLVAVENEDEIDFNTEFFLINDKLTHTDFGVDNTKISEELTPQNTAGKGNKGNSDFEEILDKILENQEGDALSVIMADFIYSPEGESNVPSALDKLKTYTQDAFLKAGKNQDLDTRIYRFASDFNGIYYDYNNRKITNIDQRPFYYIVIGPRNLMSLFNSEIASQLKDNSGFENEALFTGSNYNSLPVKVITSGVNGRIKTRGGDLEVMSYPRTGNLEFIALVNMEKLPVSQSYILDGENYKLSNPEFGINEVGVVKGKNIKFSKSGVVKMDPSTLVDIKGEKYTHAIKFSADGLVSENLNFSLQKRIPHWVEKANSDDDREIKSDSLEQTKTFSFGHLVSGISEAYEQQSGSNKYFNITIPVIQN